MSNSSNVDMQVVRCRAPIFAGEKRPTAWNRLQKKSFNRSISISVWQTWYTCKENSVPRARRKNLPSTFKARLLKHCVFGQKVIFSSNNKTPMWQARFAQLGFQVIWGAVEGRLKSDRNIATKIKAPTGSVCQKYMCTSFIRGSII